MSKRDYASFVDIETVIPEKDFDKVAEKYTTSPDRGETMSRSMGYDPRKLSGRIRVKKIHTLFVNSLLI